MCNLYAMTHASAAIAQLFRVDQGARSNLPALPAIRPTHQAPVVRREKDGSRTLVNMRWGFPLAQTSQATGKPLAPKPVTNARSDRIAQSPFWASSFQARRCLVPASAFCEWSDGPAKRQHWFTLPGAPDGLFAFAGLWRSWTGVLQSRKVTVDVMAFVTCPPNDLVAPIHGKAMPVILTGAASDGWIDGRMEEALALCAPYPASAMQVEQRDEAMTGQPTLL